MTRRWQQPELLLLALLTCVEGCSVDGDDVRRHANDWKNRKISDYVFVFFEGCFCGFPDTGGIRVVVRDNVARTAFGVKTGLPLPSYATTIDEIFQRIAESADQNPDEFEVKYDPHDGFIASAKIEQDTGAEDGGYNFATRCFSRDIEAGCPITTLTLEECEKASGTPTEAEQDILSNTCGADRAIGQIVDSPEVCCAPRTRPPSQPPLPPPSS